MAPNTSSNDTGPVAHAGVLTRERVTTITLFILTAIAVYLCYRIAYPFLPALTWALALAVVARPMHLWVARRVGYRGVAAGISVTLVTLLLLAPIILLSAQLVSQASTYVKNLESFEKQASSGQLEQRIQGIPWLAEGWNWLKQRAQIQRELRGLFTAFGQGISTTLSGSIWVATQLLITLLVLFFLFRDEPKAIHALRDYLPLASDETDQVLSRMNDTIHATIYGTVVVAAVQGALGGLMFWWLGVPAPLFWGFVMGVLAVIPYLGAFVIWAPAAIYLAMEGSVGKAALLTAWGLIVVGLIDNLLYPILVGKRLRQHTLVASFAIIGGLTAFGASGIVLGPVIVSTTAALIDIWWRRTAAGQAADATAPDEATESG